MSSDEDVENPPPKGIMHKSAEVYLNQEQFIRIGIALNFIFTGVSMTFSALTEDLNQWIAILIAIAAGLGFYIFFFIIRLLIKNIHTKGWRFWRWCDYNGKDITEMNSVIFKKEFKQSVFGNPGIATAYFQTEDPDSQCNNSEQQHPTDIEQAIQTLEQVTSALRKRTISTTPKVANLVLNNNNNNNTVKKITPMSIPGPIARIANTNPPTGIKLYIP